MSEDEPVMVMVRLDDLTEAVECARAHLYYWGVSEDFLERIEVIVENATV